MTKICTFGPKKVNERGGHGKAMMSAKKKLSERVYGKLTGPIMRGKCSISSILVGTGGEGVRVEIVVKFRFMIFG